MGISVTSSLDRQARIFRGFQVLDQGVKPGVFRDNVEIGLGLTGSQLPNVKGNMEIERIGAIASAIRTYSARSPICCNAEATSKLTFGLVGFQQKRGP